MDLPKAIISCLDKIPGAMRISSDFSEFKTGLDNIANNIPFGHEGNSLNLLIRDAVTTEFEKSQYDHNIFMYYVKLNLNDQIGPGTAGDLFPFLGAYHYYHYYDPGGRSFSQIYLPNLSRREYTSDFYNKVLALKDLANATFPDDVFEKNNSDYNILPEDYAQAYLEMFQQVKDILKNEPSQENILGDFLLSSNGPPGSLTFQQVITNYLKTYLSYSQPIRELNLIFENYYA